MLIGERLRKIRDSLGLTQTQMAAGIINRSFYSRVEKNKNAISTRDLMKILYHHEVSMVQFCQELGETKPQIVNYQEEIIQAYLKEDIVTLKKIYKKRNFVDIRIKSFILLLISKLEEKIDEVKSIIHKDPNYSYLQECNWSEENLWFTYFVMDLYNMDELQNLVNTLVNKYQNRLSDRQTAHLVARVLIKYLDFCVKKHQMNKEMNDAIKLLKFLPNEVEFGIYRILAVYYEEVLNKNYQNVNLIVDTLQDNGLNYKSGG
ncbi:helix-turn-helix domain-containing protein [Lactobacillus ultunensis]|uniref:helix-turn-helix domain-containing protein n=1 Tax=Lactobacillus ultunensis TaxID=227945 RepID=UPI001911EF72|nr:helix-turn-helix transcriptional regulator [Lactobacillus ultunensis]QQP27903.1 helix-turn-helix transcriptional regulator [Lactobacillus ultunensis]